MSRSSPDNDQEEALPGLASAPKIATPEKQAPLGSRVSLHRISRVVGRPSSPSRAGVASGIEGLLVLLDTMRVRFVGLHPVFNQDIAALFILHKLVGAVGKLLALFICGIGPQEALRIFSSGR